MQARFQVLVDRSEGPDELSAELREGYGGGLSFSEAPPGRPLVYSNFVTSLDGLVTFGIEGASEGRLIALKSREDQWLMALLRSSADAVFVGAGTLRADSSHAWTVETLRTVESAPFLEWRREAGRGSHPIQCIVTESGRIPAGANIFQRSDLTKVIFTTDSGARNIPGDLPATRVLPLTGEDGVDLAKAAEALRSEFSVKRMLCEGGPHLFSRMLQANLIDECFQTVSPQVIGAERANARRLSLTEGVAFSPEDATKLRLVSARVGQVDSNHLFLRFCRA